MTENILLPFGWTKEAQTDDKKGLISVITNTIRCHVTINFKSRWWSLGHATTASSSSPGCSSKGKAYSGRFWRKELVEDALLALQKLED